ncbi:MAG: hypothetical protein AAF513_06245 [Pseudomonadota bacterium]
MHNVNLGGGVHLNQYGSSLSGQFNISNLLPSSQNTPYDVTAAKVEAFGYSAADPITYQTRNASTRYSTRATYRWATGYRRTCNSWGWSCYYTSYGYRAYAGHATDSYYSGTVTNVSRDSVRDTMQLTSGSQANSDAVDTHLRQNVYTNTYYRRSGNYYSGYSTTRLYNYNLTDHLYGDLGITQVLNATSLQDLSLDGLLNFNVAATLGQFRLTGLRLTADVNMRSAAVPEPGGAIMLLLAGLCAGAARRFSAATAEA